MIVNVKILKTVMIVRGCVVVQQKLTIVEYVVVMVLMILDVGVLNQLLENVNVMI